MMGLLAVECLVFKLSSLARMVDTKSTDNSTSLMQYVATMLEKQAPALLKFGAELPHVESASKASLQGLSAELNSLNKEFAQVQKTLELFQTTQKGTLGSERFVEVMSPFVDKARDDLRQMSESLQQAQQKYSEAAAFFGEDPSTTPSEEFFPLLSQFIMALDDAVKQNVLAAANAEKAKKREEAKTKRQADMAVQKKGPTPGPGGDSVVDELFGALQGGNFFKNRRAAQQQAGVPAAGPSGKFPPQPLQLPVARPPVPAKPAAAQQLPQPGAPKAPVK